MEKKIKLTTVIYALLVVAAVYLVAAGALAYKFDSRSGLIRKTVAFLPYPAVIIGNTSFITISEVNENMDSIRRFYENQDFSQTGLRVDFSTDDGQKRLKVKEKNLLNKMIDNWVIKEVANKRGIRLTDEIVSQEVERKINEYGSRETLAKNMQDLYGWNIEKFKEKLVMPDMYKEKLTQSVKESDGNNLKARNKIEKAWKDLEGGGNFAEIAKNYSEGDSAKNGGDLGWLSADQMLPQLAETAFGLEKGKVSGIVESSLGFHILKVEDKKTETSIDKVKVRQILVRITDFSDWLIQQEKNINIYIPLKDFRWNKEAGEVEFTNDDLKQFEDNLDKNSTGDISVLF